jgi:sortase (surface protein transpeptidase)
MLTPAGIAAAVAKRSAPGRRLDLLLNALVVVLVLVIGWQLVGLVSSGDAAPVEAVIAEAPAPPVTPDVEESSPPESPQPRPAAPVTLRIPAIRVDAEVVPVGLEPDLAMEIPSDVRTVGWYDPFDGLGVIPGESGTAVIAGHVDSRTQGRGAFWPLRSLVAEDLVEVVHSDGTVTTWVVESVVLSPKEDIDLAEIFTFAGARRLALVTCGGRFDRSAGAYLENYVVMARPLVVEGVGATSASATATLGS